MAKINDVRNEVKSLLSEINYHKERISYLENKLREIEKSEDIFVLPNGYVTRCPILKTNT